MNWILWIIRQLFPTRCCHCGAVQSFALCLNCLTQCQPAADWHWVPAAYDAAHSVFRYDGPVKSLIHSLKFSNQKEIASVIAPQIVRFISEMTVESDAVIFIPGSKDRLKKRGFNTPEWIFGSALSSKKIPVVSALIRTRDTRPLYTLSPEARETEIAGVFRTTPLLVNGRSLLIIDDILTTGTTANEVAGILRAAGARRLELLTLAVAKPV
ncbi:ComF family protein [bacterium]|nr:ComF family protein [bacterium]